MAGRGFAPGVDDSRKARGGKGLAPMRVLHADPADQPFLPADHDWHPQTIAWWKMWADSPLSADFTTTDWSELLDTALIHTAYWNGSYGNAAELRLRAAKFGATPEDRARLRIQVVQADEAEEKRGSGSPTHSSRGKYAPPRAV